MIKVIEKVFDILELLATEPSRELPLTEIAKGTGVNKATAGRILKDLVARGYASQNSLRGGYSLGPMAYALPANGVFRKDIVDAVSPLVTECARELRESVLIAALHQGRRHILCHENGNPELDIIIDKPFYDDLYVTATGRMLLAHAGQGERDSYVATHGMPLEKWDGIDTEAELVKRLAEIRGAGMISCKSPNRNLWILAFPIHSRERAAAALGISVPVNSFQGGRAKQLLETGAGFAARMSETLSKNHPNPGGDDAPLTRK